MSQGVNPRGGARGQAAGWRLALLLPLLALGVTAQAAKPEKDRHAPRFELRLDEPRREAGGRCPGVSLDQAIESTERRYKARVVKVNVVEESNRCVYVLRLLSEEGRVWTVRVDSRTGG
jgi:uncharacterized membrane protein YkoI